MALCHTVQTLEELSGKETPINSEAPQYQASSPDEKALVEAAARYDYAYGPFSQPFNCQYLKPQPLFDRVYAGKSKY